MLEAQERETINKGMFTLWVIWAAMLGSLLIYILVCHQLGEEMRGGFAESGFSFTFFRNILYGVVAVELIMIYYLRKFMLKGRPAAAKADMPGRSSNLKQPPFVGLYTSIEIISLAIADSIGIYGLVLFLLGGDFRVLYTFIVISALAMVFFRPKKEELERLAMAYRKRNGSTSEM
jgi:F0F1-type ATP synthase membrane subunit c/vacuolar-type H+-ATPase subunit K